MPVASPTSHFQSKLHQDHNQVSAESLVAQFPYQVQQLPSNLDYAAWQTQQHSATFATSAALATPLSIPDD
jgi:hypothetical protein